MPPAVDFDDTCGSERRSPMDTSPERKLYDSARAYYRGADILMKQASPSAPARQLAQPAVTCAALSLKLYLKCLLAFEGKDKEGKIYGIAELYRSLSDGKQKMIVEKFDEFSNTELSPDELVGHLTSLDKAFERWRYIHEDDARSVNLEDLEEMILAAKAAIEVSRPDWAE
jgi:hypothetical protein